MKNKNKMWLFAGAGIVLGYRAVMGMGVFNRVRFRRQHSALQSYVDTHFPGASVGELRPVGGGWSCVAAYCGKNIVIHILPGANGGYIFTPREV